MHFQGQQVVSIATQRSMRNLVTASMATILLFYQNVDLKHAKLFEVEIAASNPEIYFGVAVIYFLTGHLVNWRADFLSLGKWNVADTEIETGFGGTGNQITKLQQIINRLEVIHGDGFTQNELAQHLPQTSHDLKVLVARMQRHHFHYFIFFWGWYLIVPLALSIAAINFLASTY